MGDAPIDKLQDFPVEIALFEREGQNGAWINADVSKTYKHGEEYKKTRSFNRTDLLKLNALVPQAISRMQELEQGQAPAPPNQANGQDRTSLKQEAQQHLASQGQGQTEGHDP